MKSRRRSLLTLAIAGVAAAAVVTGGTPGTAGPAPEVAAVQAGPTYVYKVHAPLGAAAQNLLGRGFDVLEDRDGDYLFVLGDATTGPGLKQAGFTAVIDEVLPAPEWQPPAKKSQSPTFEARRHQRDLLRRLPHHQRPLVAPGPGRRGSTRR